MYTANNPAVDKYKLMLDIIHVLLPDYVMEGSVVDMKGCRILTANILHEFANMEQARAVIAGVDDPAKEAIAYLDHHFLNGPKPLWYRNLTEN